MSTLYLGNAYLRKRAHNATKVMHSLKTDDIIGAQPKRSIRRTNRHLNVNNSLNYMPTYNANFQAPAQVYNPQMVAGINSQQINQRKQGSRNRNRNRNMNVQPSSNQPNRFGMSEMHVPQPQNSQPNRRNPYQNKQNPYQNQNRQYPDLQQQQQKQQSTMRNPMYSDYAYDQQQQQQQQYGNMQGNQNQDSLDVLKKQHKQRYGDMPDNRQDRQQGSRRSQQRGNSRQNLNNMPVDQSNVMGKPPMRPMNIDNMDQMNKQSRQPQTIQPKRKQFQQSSDDQYIKNKSQFYGVPSTRTREQGNLNDNASRFYGESAGNGNKNKDQGLKQNENAFYGQDEVGSKPYNTQQQRTRKKPQNIRHLRAYNPITLGSFNDYKTEHKVIRGKYDYDPQFQKNQDLFYDVDRTVRGHKIRGKLQGRSMNPDFNTEAMSYGQQRRQYV